MTKVKDAVCGMWIDPGTTSAKIEYQGKTYYFCAPECLSLFKKDPERYISGSTEERSSHKYQQHKGHRGGHSYGGCCCH